MSDEEWAVGFAKSIGVFLNGDAIPSRDERGQRIVDDSFYLLFNAHHEPLDFTLPGEKWGKRAELVLDTYALNGPEDAKDDLRGGEDRHRAGALAARAALSEVVESRRPRKMKKAGATRTGLFSRLNVSRTGSGRRAASGTADRGCCRSGADRTSTMSGSDPSATGSSGWSGR